MNVCHITWLSIWPNWLTCIASSSSDKKQCNNTNSNCSVNIDRLEWRLDMDWSLTCRSKRVSLACANSRESICSPLAATVTELHNLSAVHCPLLLLLLLLLCYRLTAILSNVNSVICNRLNTARALLFIALAGLCLLHWPMREPIGTMGAIGSIGSIGAIGSIGSIGTMITDNECWVTVIFYYIVVMVTAWCWPTCVHCVCLLISSVHWLSKECCEWEHRHWVLVSWSSAGRLVGWSACQLVIG